MGDSMTRISDYLDEATECVRAVCHLNHSNLQRDDVVALRTLLWRISEVLPEDSADVMRLRQIGDRLTGEEGSAERLAALYRTAKPLPHKDVRDID